MATPFPGLSKPSWLGIFSRTSKCSARFCTSRPARMRMAPRGPQKGMEAEPMAGVSWSTPPQASCFSRWRNHGHPSKDRGPGGHSEDWVCAQLCRSRASGRSAMGKLRVRFEPSSPRISTEDKQIISTWARGEGGGEEEGCQREAAVQIPPDSSPAAPTSPVIPPNKLQSKQGAQDPAVAATLSSFRGIFPSSPSHTHPPPTAPRSFS